MTSPSVGFTLRALRATLRLLYSERDALDTAIRRLERIPSRASHRLHRVRRRRATLMSKLR